MNKLIPGPIRVALRRLAWNAIRLTSVTTSGLTLRITNASDWHIFNEIFVRGEYDEAISMALDSASNQMQVLDLGANVGFFSLRVLDRVRRQARTDLRVHVVAVEGSPTFSRQLSRRLK